MQSCSSPPLLSLRPAPPRHTATWPGGDHPAPGPPPSAVWSLCGCGGHPPALLVCVPMFSSKIFLSSSLGGKHVQVKGWLTSPLPRPLPPCTQQKLCLKQHSSGSRAPRVLEEAAHLSSLHTLYTRAGNRRSFLTMLYSAFSFPQNFRSQNTYVCGCVGQFLPTLKQIISNISACITVKPQGHHSEVSP